MQRRRPSGPPLEGEPGVGKTTLWLAALEKARALGFRVLSARPASAESVLAYSSLSDLLGGVDATCWARLPSPQRLAVDRALLRTETDGPATNQRAVAAGFLSIVEDLVDERPVLLAIDDVQWLDASSARVVAFTARRLSGSVGLLGAVRVDPRSHAAADWLQMAEPDPMRRVRVNPLSLGDCTASCPNGSGDRSHVRRWCGYSRFPAETRSMPSNLPT